MFVSFTRYFDISLQYENVVKEERIIQMYISIDDLEMYLCTYVINRFIYLPH